MTNDQYFEYLIRLGDTPLILSHRLGEWCGHGPILEEDLALTNTALDYVGQCTNAFKKAGEVEGKGRDEDDIAFVRLEHEYKNFLIAELPKGDYAFTVCRQFLFSTWYYLFLKQLNQSKDEFMVAFADKSIKEVKYHWQHSSDWVKRLGDGTEESHQKMQTALNEIWEFTGELFINDTIDHAAMADGIGVDLAALKSEWDTIINQVLDDATLTRPTDGHFQTGGRHGRHTEYMGYLLSELQYMQRAYPNAKW
jgi:ring-1,2-phenylacetyl-CoA epoxidase subunit PaaC